MFSLPHNACNTGYPQHISFFHILIFYFIVTFSAHADRASGNSSSLCFNLIAHIYHNCISIFIKMRMRFFSLLFSIYFSSIFFLFFVFLFYFPKPQFGNVQTEQFKHKPPSPNSSSSAVILSSAIIRGSARSKIVLLHT